MKTLSYVTLHLHDQLPQIGSGFRPVLVMRGRKKATLLSPPTLRHAKIPIEARRSGERGVVIEDGLDTLRSTPNEFDPARLLKIIEDNRAMRERLKIFDGGETAKEVMELLRAAVENPALVEATAGERPDRELRGGATTHHSKERNNAKTTLPIRRRRRARGKTPRHQSVRRHTKNAA